MDIASRRVLIDWEKIYKSGYPKSISVNKGHSSIYQISQDWFFKRKQQDGNYGADSMQTNNRSSIVQYFHSMGSFDTPTPFSQHHFVYNELKGCLEDVAEVFCYTVSKGLGTTKKTDIYGRQYDAPVVDVAEYQLAEYKDKEGILQRGCLSRNILGENDNLIQGDFLLKFLNEGNIGSNLPNYLRSIQSYADTIGLAIDPNLQRDLIVNSYFCWKVGNTDNHRNNITFVQTKGPDGTPYIKVSTLIDNGGAYDSSLTYFINNSQISIYERMFQKELGTSQVTTEQAAQTVFTENRFIEHTAFKLGAGDIYGHPKSLGTKPMEYEYDVAAYALANPEIYSSIYQIEQNFNVAEAARSMSKDYGLRWPDFYLEAMNACNGYKTSVISQVMADCFFHTAYTSCIGEVNLEQPNELYVALQQQMRALPLQESVDGYVQEFMKLANQANIPVDQATLETLNFLPEQGQPMEQVAEQPTLTLVKELPPQQ